MKKGRILLIIHDVYQDINVFPLGSAYVASVLKNDGHHVDTYCQDLYHYSNEDLAIYLKNNKYDVIGIGFLAARFDETIVNLCKVVNKYKKNAWLVLGGHGPSPIAKYVLRKTNVDIITIGEAEKSIVEIVKEKINRTCNLRSINGIAWRNNEEIFINNREDPISVLDDIPFPLWDCFPIDKYKKNVKIFEQPE